MAPDGDSLPRKDHTWVVTPELQEHEDVHGDQFGLPFCRLYRETTPDYEKAHRKAQRAFRRLRKRYLA